MTKLPIHFSRSMIALAAMLSASAIQGAWAQPLPVMGAASNFAVLSAAPYTGGAVTCTDSSVNGNVGSSGPMASVVQTGCVISGAITAPVSARVLADFNTAYNQYATVPCTGTLEAAYTGAALTLPPGVYCSAAAVTLTDSTLTLDGLGNANAVWIFKVGTGGTGALTGTNFSVIMKNGGQSCNVSWWAAQAATLTTSSFQGTILAGAAITMTGLAGTTTPFNGNALASAAVTLTNFNVNSCQAAGNGGNGGNGGNSHSNCKRHESSEHDSSHHGSSERDSSHHDSSKHDSRDHDSEDCDSDHDSDHDEAGSPYNPFNLTGDSERSSGDHGRNDRSH